MEVWREQVCEQVDEAGGGQRSTQQMVSREKQRCPGSRALLASAQSPQVQTVTHTSSHLSWVS